MFQHYILPWAVKIGSPGFRRFVVDILPWKNLHVLRDIIDTMHNTCRQIYGEKKRALEAGDEAVSKQISQGKDIISILSTLHMFSCALSSYSVCRQVKANAEAAPEDQLPESEILGHVCHSFLFLGGSC